MKLKKASKITAVIVVLALMTGLAVGISLWALHKPAEIHIGEFSFPETFKIGAATASYQIEGAWDEDGKSPNIWDTLTHNNPEYIVDRSNGDVAADSYRFYQKDIDALSSLGTEVYRFSISWSRIIPDGTKTNMKGIEYYGKLIDGLIDKGIEPLVTMYHWDLPQYIQDLGGWTNPLIVDYFTDFADVLYEHFGDRVKRWITVNEPSETCGGGYGYATRAPAISSPGVGDYLCVKHTLLAHAAAYHLYKEKYFSLHGGQVGINLVTGYRYPLNASVAASYCEKSLEFDFGKFADPIFSRDGGYPQIVIDEIARKSEAEGRLRSRLPELSQDEKEYIQGTSDFLALNYYSSRLVAPIAGGPDEAGWRADTDLILSFDPSWEKGKSSFMYSIPQGLRDLLVWIKNKYNNPEILITENGWSDDGQLDDDGRVKYIKSHMAAVAEAIRVDNCNVTAYTVWSLVDNFEWLAGYTERFGIFSINFISAEKERVPKGSAQFFKDMIATKSFDL